MSSSEEEENSHNASAAPQLEEVHADMLRILLSTDNHLGYLETDPVRGMDSFAAFEEVLYLAKQRKCDMVLLAGDLFHDNKPSRRTLHKTMDIMRRYCMGHDPVKIQILSDQAKDFRNLNGTVNYEDECYSVDLPVLSIHGNHDDPVRSSSGDLLAALDILSVSNLCNYFGRQDEINRVEISPVLIQKGNTKVALYGLGSMRDERLNRMWQAKKVRFLRPGGVGEDDQDEDSDENTWFNIFALHQNRDTGRGSKNCVHESFLPPWLDFVVWGHEHESVINPSESVVGTFRISQPGSSVATSLVAGEAARKHVGILDIRGTEFRVTPIPLTNVRSFITADLPLADQREKLDPEDPKIDDHITKILEEEVKYRIHDARQKTAQLLADAEKEGNFAASSSDLKYTLEQRNQVLVRIRVEHSGFTTLSNQRFGARFVGDVANPTDILLFHRSKASAGKKSGCKKGKGGSVMDDPVPPDEMEKVRVEDLVKESLDGSDQKLEVLKEDKLAKALEEFVEKAQTNAISDVAAALLSKQVKKLVRNDESGAKGDDEDMDDEQEAETSQTGSKRKRRDVLESEEDEKENQKASSKRATASKSRDRSRVIDVDDSDEEAQLSSKSKAKSGKAKKDPRRSSGDSQSFVARSSSQASNSRRKKPDSDEDSDVVEVFETAKPRSAPRRLRRGKVNYTMDPSDDDEVMDHDDFLDEDEDEDEPPKKKASRKPTKLKRGTTKSSSSRGKATTQDSSGFHGSSRGMIGLDSDEEDWQVATTDD